ncbi:recombinase family protein [Cohnella soli]|uniref:Recombinase family protein n=1 Tax=Cohnella soli TaxID=425005 RepID=A0ABW0HN60_9BACL
MWTKIGMVIMLGKVYGYARVSTSGQDNGLETQEQLLEEAGCSYTFKEMVSGKSTNNRIELQRAMELLSSGDTLVVAKIDRLARSISDLDKIVKELLAKGVNVRFLKEDMTFKVDTKPNSMHSLLFNILGSFAQFERELINERTSEGRARAKEKGTHMGRPSKDKKDIARALKLYSERDANGMSVNDISKLTGVPRSSIYAEINKSSL